MPKVSWFSKSTSSGAHSAPPQALRLLGQVACTRRKGSSGLWFPRAVSSRGRLRPAITLFTALGLFAGSLALLYVGQFILLDDTSGFGSDEAVMPWGFLAGLAATLSVIVATAERMARRLLGGAMLVLDAVLIWQATSNDGFRFIWAGAKANFSIFRSGSR